jgi:protein-tyrosine kinase
MSRIHEALKRIAAERRPGTLAKLSSSGADRVAPLTMEILASPKLETAPNAPPPPPLTELREHCSRPGWKGGSSGNVFAAPPSVCAEQFRKLRSRLYQIGNKKPVRAVQITSSLPGEGKTFVAFNLAVAISQDRGRRVLLVDADLRASKLAAYLGAPGTPGLSEYLRGAAPERSVIQTNEKRDFFFMPAGEPVENPTELLMSGRFHSLLERLAPVFDWIIVDTPPVLPVSDAGILAASCDGLLMVVRAGATGYDEVEAALKELPPAKVLGAILNRAEEALPLESYSYYGGMPQSRLVTSSGLDPRAQIS